MHSLEPNRFLERSDYLLKALLCSDQYFRRRTYTCRIGFERNNQNPIREWLTHKSIVLIGSDGFFFWRTEVVSHVYRLKICLTVAFGAAEMSPMQVMFTEHSIKLT